MEKAAYEYCDEAHTLRAIYRHLAALVYARERETLRWLLEKWVEQRLMLRDGDWFLSLAVSADGLAEQLGSSGVIRQALVAVIAGLIEDFM